MRAHGLALLTTLVAVALAAPSTVAQEPETFEQARATSVQSQRPILLEFFRDG